MTHTDVYVCCSEAQSTLRPGDHFSVVLSLNQDSWCIYCISSLSLWLASSLLFSSYCTPGLFTFPLPRFLPLFPPCLGVCSHRALGRSFVRVSLLSPLRRQMWFWATNKLDSTQNVTHWSIHSIFRLLRRRKRTIWWMDELHFFVFSRSRENYLVISGKQLS